MKLAVAQTFNLPFLPPNPLPTHSLSATVAVATTAHRRVLTLNPRRPNHPIPLKSHSPNPQTAADDHGIPIEHVKTLAQFKSRHNYIRVLQVSRAADHPLAGSRLLLLDAPGNIHSISYLFKSLTNAYYDVLATLPPILPPGPVALLGFGAGSAARIILELYPDTTIHGWELDPSVIAVAREYFGLEKLEKKHAGRLFIHAGNALSACSKDGFAGIIIDLFSKGRVIPELQDPATWEKLRSSLRKGGRMMVNVGGSCVEPEDIRKDGRVIMEETLKAMDKVFPGEVNVLSLDDRKDDSSVAMTGELPDVDEWKKVLRRPLKFYAEMWEPYDSADYSFCLRR
ncbi:prbable polyamine aminopropyl transferase [Phtheirospermum japonicum]|uniref:Prbable polyamine aminopropyl transferase n=1 Tax=Phtheirospermum japonicum TaxID=374723 RepID=A0A830DR62_9LAMI|nr:prbable polyamine aminopropyl transferase [Phtheirospermum japonicum]GFQ08778.1 prbable polyamine aminopropyl transferase [Phtheirospermum japonicum]